ncbi:hypothetical protein SAMN04487989_101691 [Bizionia echini]|uniref:Uncharacterized protein n=2 Tax=Bizionia echini TaxID=649333 RepID=A0A1I4ZBB1_9FLAO|nr:hypothetical protein SAMN04487989_101691 [Bizionia echini]
MALVFTEVASINLFFELINRYTTIEITSPFSTIPMALFSVGILYFFNYYLFEKDEKFQEINNTFLKKKETDKLWFIKGVLVVLLIAGILLFYMIYPYKLVLF